MEARHAGHWRGAAHRRCLPLPGARLGHRHQPHHGRAGLPHRAMVHARHGGAAMAALAADAVSDLVWRGWLLLAVLGMEEPGSTGIDARGQRTCIAVFVLDVRAGLVLPWHAQ